MAEPARLAAVQVLLAVLPAGGDGQSLREALPRALEGLADSDRGLAQDLAYGVCRHYRRLHHWLNSHLDKPLKSSARAVELALLCGIHELWFSQRPAHAVVNAWPGVMRTLKAPWASGLANALLRQAADADVDAVLAAQKPAVRYSLPAWLWAALREAWPAQCHDLAAALLAAPPFTVRLSPAAPADALQQWQQAGFQASQCRLAQQAWTLSPARAPALVPGFAEGWVSVQDEAAQLPVDVLLGHPLRANARVLDACAAPGGKTGQLLERRPDFRVLALDESARRLARVQDNLSRIGHQAELIAADASQPQQWFDGEPFDAVLLDAPCSATGIIRRQPDVRWHRKGEDIPALCGLQADMLDALWPLIAPGGVLVYATCSILPQENSEQVAAFLARHADARDDTPAFAVSAGGPGCQLLPGTGEFDGFYFCRLQKIGDNDPVQS